jgi:bifunctional non-homologous end joining protein LigD
MGLSVYRRKRDFQKTAEPRGERAKRSAGELAYVIQKHDASHLHYDFRLEVDGVLKSWAVPKGPDLDPAVKRLAMQVEDHPLEYGGFEGTIPQGEYGGGTVMLWDRGTWEPIGDPAKGLREGHLKFILHGVKLKGGWMLVRKGGRKSAPDERHWFFFKERDDFARPGESITEEMPKSVASGRDLDEIADQSNRVWGPEGETRRARRALARRKGAKKSTKRGQPGKRRSAIPRPRSRKADPTGDEHPPRVAKNGDQNSLDELLARTGAPRARLPQKQAVELATLVDEAPSGDEWDHEIKFDGYRMLCRVAKGKAHFISRNGHDWTAKFPELAASAGELAVDAVMLDGEIVALEPDGTTSFQALQNVFQTGRTRELVYYVFDVLHVSGYDLTSLPLESRREILRSAVRNSPPSIRYSDSIEGSGAEVIDKACRLGLEGIVSKRKESLYRPGRGLDWLKVKCTQREEFLIGGFTKPAGHRHHFGALALGYYNRSKQLIYAGRVGTGFNDKKLASLHQKLAKIVRADSPFSNLSGAMGDARDVTWVKPALVAEIRFSNWTNEGLLRHPSFQGLREDKPAAKVIHDEPLPVAAVNGGRIGTERTKSKRSHQVNASKATRKRSAPPALTGSSNGDIAGVRLTHPEKVLYPDGGITKRDLASYYEAVAKWMLPHVVERPLAIVRCPEGSTKACFFQKHPGEGFTEHLRQIDISQSGKPEYNMMVEDVAALIALVQMGVLEIHVWGSRAKQLEKPDRLIFDLDPDPSVEWPEVIKAARDVRSLLDELGLKSFVKTTGGKGLHVVVPIQPRTEWDEAKAFCRSVADFMVRLAPDRFIAKASKAARKGKIFIDYLRNGRGATSVAPYSTRNRPGATVSTPLGWDELSADIHSDHYTIENVPARLAKLTKDPWTDLAKTKQSLTAAMLKRLAPTPAE